MRLHSFKKPSSMAAGPCVHLPCSPSRQLRLSRRDAMVLTAARASLQMLCLQASGAAASGAALLPSPPVRVRARRHHHSRLRPSRPDVSVHVASPPLASTTGPNSSSTFASFQASLQHLQLQHTPSQQQPQDAPSVPSTPQQLANGVAFQVNGAPQQAAAATQPSQPQDKELLEELRACSTWQDVLEIIADEAPDISLYTVVQASSRVLALVRTSPQGAGRTMAQVRADPGFATLLKLLFAGVPHMTRVQLCNSLHALAQLRVEVPEAMHAAYAQRAAQLAPELNGRDLSMLLHGWATMRHNPGRATLDLIGFRTKVLLEAGQVEGQSLSMLLHALAVLDYRNHLLLGAAATALVQQLPSMSPQGVANSSWALAKLGHFSYAALAGAAQAYIAAPEAFKTQEACNLLWALTAQRFYPQEVLSAMVPVLIKRSSLLRPADFAQLFHTFGTFAVHPGPQLLSELLGSMGRQLPRFSTQELCQTYWGLGLIGEARQPVCHQIAAMLPDHFEANRMTESLLRLAFQAFLCGKLADALDAPAAADADGEGGATRAAKRAAASFPPLMMAAMKRAWISATRSNTTSDNSSAEDADSAAPQTPQAAEAAQQPAAAAAVDGASEGGPDGPKPRKWKRPTIKQEVAGLVKQLRVPHELARPTKDGLVMIDVALKAGEQRYIALQVVMEHEHTCNTGQFLGPLQFQRQVLEMNGWEVRHVRAKDLKALDKARKPLFMADLLRGMGIRVRGAPQAGGAKGKPARPGSSSSSGKAVSGLDLVMSEGAPARR